MKKLLLTFLSALVLLTSCSPNIKPPPDLPPDTEAQTVFAAEDYTEPESVEDTETVEVTDSVEDTENVETEPVVTDSEPVTVETQSETSAAVVPEPEPMPEPDTARKYIYITFDDGPGKYTEEVLEILEKYDVKATFFVVGQFVGYYPERVRSINGAGHTLGCHSATHEYRKIYASPESITADIAAWENSVAKALGYVPRDRIYRFPGGSTCTAIEKDSFDVLYEAVTALGYRAFDWTCSNNDMWFGQMKQDQTKVDYLKESVISSLGWCGEPRILLLHETVPETVEMLDWLIGYLLDEGYSFATLDTYEGDYLFAR